HGHPPDTGAWRLAPSVCDRREHMHQADFLLQLALLWGAAKLAAELAERLGQPPVLGELLAGILLGGSLLGWVKPDEPTLVRLAGRADRAGRGGGRRHHWPAPAGGGERSVRGEGALGDRDGRAGRGGDWLPGGVDPDRAGGRRRAAADGAADADPRRARGQRDG